LPAALLAAGLGQAATAAVPGALTASTTQAALLIAAGKAASGVVSAQTAALVRSSLRAMTVGKLKSVGAVLLAVTLLGTGAGLFTRGAAAPDAPAPAGTDRAQPGQPGPENDRTMTVAGRVLDPDGKPAAGAQVAVVAHRTRPTDTTGQREE